MRYRIGIILVALLLTTIPLRAQESVCTLFKDLKAANGRRFSVKGELFLNDKLSALASADCENKFELNSFIWPTVISLRPTPTLQPFRLRELDTAAKEIQKARMRGKSVRAFGTFVGRLNVITRRDNAYGPEGKFPAELVFDDLKD